MAQNFTPFEMLSEAEKKHISVALKALNDAQTHLLQAFCMNDCPDYLVEGYDAVGDLINGLEMYSLPEKDIPEPDDDDFYALNR